MEVLLMALMFLESSNDPNAVNGEAVGILQITPIYLEDVNRILGYPAFSLDDRLDVEASKEMATIYLQHYGAEYEMMTERQLAMIHRGGQSGWLNYGRYGDNAELVMRTIRMMQEKPKGVPVT